MPQKQYLDNNGNLIAAKPQGKLYLDEQGNPYEAPAATEPFVDPMDQVRRNQAAQFPTSKEQGGVPGEAVQPPSLLSRVAAHLPSPRTVARVGGAAIGGGIGAAGGTVLGTPLGTIPGAALGGATGASIGESVYQMFNPAPTSGEALRSNMEAQIQGGLQEGLPAAIIGLGPKMLRSSAAGKVGESVETRQQPIKIRRATKKVAEGAIETFPVRPTTGTLFNKLESMADDAGRAVETAYQRAGESGTTMNAGPVIQNLEQKMSRYFINGQPIAGTEARVSAYREVMDWLRANHSFNVNDFRRIKQVWDGIVQPTRLKGNFAPPDPAKAEAMKEASDEVRAAIHNAFPYTKTADKAAHTWITLKNVLGEATDKSFGMESLQRIVPRSAIGGTIGAGVAGLSGDNMYKGALTGAVLGNLTQTALWNTLSVKERVILIKALESEAGKAALRAIALTGSGAAQEALQ